MKLPTNVYDDDTSERDALLAVYELLRSIRVALWIIVALLVVLGMVVYVGFDNVTAF